MDFSQYMCTFQVLGDFLIFPRTYLYWSSFHRDVHFFSTICSMALGRCVYCLLIFQAVPVPSFCKIKSTATPDLPLPHHALRSCFVPAVLIHYFVYPLNVKYKSEVQRRTPQSMEPIYSGYFFLKLFEIAKKPLRTIYPVNGSIPRRRAFVVVFASLVEHMHTSWLASFFLKSSKIIAYSIIHIPSIYYTTYCSIKAYCKLYLLLTWP